MKRLALVGYGKMGRMIEQLAPANGFEVTVRFGSADNPGGRALTAEALSEVDAVIEFSVPEAAVENLYHLAAAKVPTVTGTTGWLSQLPEVSDAFIQSGTALVWSPNFSLGVAVFKRLVATAANLLRDEHGYGAWAWEIHHDTKKDAPSGTLLQLVEAMHQAGFTREIDVSSNRAGRHPGTHEIGFDSFADTITLRHTARDRQGFALGALKAASWAIGKSGIFTFDEMLFGRNDKINI